MKAALKFTAAMAIFLLCGCGSEAVEPNEGIAMPSRDGSEKATCVEGGQLQKLVDRKLGEYEQRAQKLVDKKLKELEQSIIQRFEDSEIRAKTLLYMIEDWEHFEWQKQETTMSAKIRLDMNDLIIRGILEYQRSKASRKFPERLENIDPMRFITRAPKQKYSYKTSNGRSSFELSTRYAKWTFRFEH